MRRRFSIPLAITLVVAACGGVVEPTDTTRPSQTSSTTTPTTSTLLPPSTTTTTILDPGDGTAPWLRGELERDGVPEVLRTQWENADNRTSCSALFPGNPADLAGQAEVRSADFGGGWAIAWDLPDGPGRFASGEYCTDCGRGAFGVAGAGLEAFGDEADRWPNIVEFEDGSRLGYGYEGDAEPDSGAPLLGYLLIKGEGCLYNVWSFLGEAHFLTLIDGLRTVRGLQGVSTIWVSERPVAPAQSLGDPPWESEPISRSQVPDLVFDEWEGEAGAPRGCPLLYPNNLAEAAGATIRRAANQGEMLVAWDLPDGPGHTGDSEPCADCGRGVIGLGTFQVGQYEGPIAYEWSDGSEARLRTGPFSYGTEAFVRVAGFDCDYWVWSHLGEDHLVTLLSNLRRVEGAP